MLSSTRQSGRLCRGSPRSVSTAQGMATKPTRMSATASETFTHTHNNKHCFTPPDLSRLMCEDCVDLSPHQEVVGDRAQLLVAGDGHTDQDVSDDGQRGDDELGGDVQASETRQEARRHL